MGALKRKTPLLARTGLKKPCVTVEALIKSGLVSTGSGFKKKPKPMRKRAKRKKGEASQIETFKAVWEERPHVSQIGGEPLTPMPYDWDDDNAVRAWVRQFSHILPKGSYLRYKHDPRNIVLKTANEHDLWEAEKWTLVDLPEWGWVFELEQDLKREANGVE